jgi:hypothetical protein
MFFYFDGSPLKEGSALINIKDSQGLSIATLTVTPNEQGVLQLQQLEHLKLKYL